MAVPKRVVDRIQKTLKSFKSILEAQRARDVSEADTVTIVKDVLCDLFGYDKYTELTSEHSIRGTYCDLAVNIDSKIALLIEVKAIGIDLKDAHVKQAVDYASNQGCEWVVLTNGVHWHLYQVIFKKPIDKKEIAHFSLFDLSHKKQDDLEKLYLLSREGFAKSALSEYRDKKEAASRYVVAAVLLNSESVRSAIRREIRRVSEVLVDEEVIERILKEEVIKREAMEGEQAVSATRRVARSSEKSIRKTPKEKSTPSEPKSKAEHT